MLIETDDEAGVNMYLVEELSRKLVQQLSELEAFTENGDLNMENFF